MKNRLGCIALILLSLWSWVAVYQSLDKPPTYYFDENIYVDAADALLQGRVENREHPPLGKFLIGESRAQSQDKISGSRLPSLLAGILVILFLGLIARELFPKRQFLFYLLPLFLVSMDPFFLNLSKIAMLDMMGLAFFTGAFYFILLAKNSQAAVFWISAIFAGLSVGIKWHFLVWTLLLFVLFSPKRSLRDGTSYFAVLLITYVMSFFPYFIWTDLPLTDFFRLQYEMFSFHSEFQVANAFQSPWWTWPLFIKPLKFLLELDADKIRTIVLVGNPIIHWLLLPMALILGLAQKENSIIWKLLLFYCGGLAFWALLPRPGYSYYYLSILPFVYLMVAGGLEKLFSNRVFLWSAVILSLLTFLLLIPLVNYDWISIGRVPTFLIF